MQEHHEKLEEETVFSLLQLIALWGEAFADDKGRVVLYDNMELQDAIELLSEHGSFRKEDQFTFNFITTEPNMNKPCDLDDIVYIFYELGAWYGYGVKYREQGFIAASSISRIFDNLVLLNYCTKHDGFYFWTDKTFNLNRQGWEIHVPFLKNYLQRRKNDILENREVLRALESLDEMNIPNDVWDNDERFKELIEVHVKNTWRDNPTVWPEVIRRQLIK